MTIPKLYFSFRKTRKFKDAVHLAYEMEKLKTKPSLLQLTKTLRRKEETRPPSKFLVSDTATRGRW